MLDVRRRRQFVIVTILAVAVLADTAVWAFACHRLQNDAAANTSGWTLAAAPPSWGGWPIAAAVTFPRATVRTAPDALPPLAWTADSLTLRLNAWAPATLVLDPAGSQTLTIGDQPPLAISASNLSATIDLRGSLPPVLHAEALAIDAPGLPLHIGTADLRLPPDGWAADIADLRIPGLSPPIASLRFGGHATPSIRPGPTATETATAWRAAGGHLALELLDLRWGNLAATATGRLTLDPALQPAGEGSLSATGLPGAVARLAEMGLISPSVGSAAGAMLAILAAPAGSNPVTLPITIRAGILSVARVPLLRLPPLRWDGP